MTIVVLVVLVAGGGTAFAYHSLSSSASDAALLASRGPLGPQPPSAGGGAATSTSFLGREVPGQALPGFSGPAPGLPAAAGKIAAVAPTGHASSARAHTGSTSTASHSGSPASPSPRGTPASPPSPPSSRTKSKPRHGGPHYGPVSPGGKQGFQAVSYWSHSGSDPTAQNLQYSFYDDTSSAPVIAITITVPDGYKITGVVKDAQYLTCHAPAPPASAITCDTAGGRAMPINGAGDNVTLTVSPSSDAALRGGTLAATQQDGTEHPPSTIGG